LTDCKTVLLSFAVVVRTSFLLFIASSLASVVALGQNSLPDTAFVAEAQKNAVKFYLSRPGFVSNVYNGTQYTEYRPQDNEHPYLTEDWIYGNVIYGGDRYESVPMLLDLSVDQLITVYPFGNAIQMIQDKVNSFELGSRKFVRLGNGQVKEGFYEQMYDGKVKFYIRREKALQVRLQGTIQESSFEMSKAYYLYKDGVYHSFKTRKKFLHILEDRKQELKRYMRESGINFGADREMNAVRVLAYYDKITS
jgi:hypothetical protein